MTFLLQLQTGGLLIVAALIMLAGAWIFSSGQQPVPRRSFGSLLVAFAFWFICISLWSITTDPTQSVFWYRAMYVIGTALPSLLLVFSLNFLPKRWPRTAGGALALAPNLWLAWVAFHSEGLRPLVAESHLFRLSDSWSLFATFFAAYFAAAVAVFLFAQRLNRLLDRTAMAALLVGSILTFNAAFAMLFGDECLHHAFRALPWASLLAALAGLAVMATFVIRERPLVDLRLVSVELAIIFSAIIILADLIAASPTQLEFTFRLAILVLLVAHGINVTRSIAGDIWRIHENEVLHEQLTKSVAQVIEGDRQKTKMISLVAHQMRAPLLGIQAYLNMAANGQFGKPPAELQKILELNCDVLTRLAQTVDNFLGVTKIELGHLDLYKSETYLPKLIGGVVDQMMPLARKKNLELSVHVSPNVPSVVCDQSVIFNVLSNMVDNAIKYTASGSVKILAERQGPFVMVTVNDTGIGFKDKDQERLTRQFQRGAAAFALESQGSGLGLYIANQLINAHSGTLIMESPGPGKGSTIGFMLPIEG